MFDGWSPKAKKPADGDIWNYEAPIKSLVCPPIVEDVDGDGKSITKDGWGKLTINSATGLGHTTMLGGTLQLGPVAGAAVLATGVNIEAGKLVFEYSGTSDNPKGTISSALAYSYDVSSTRGHFKQGLFQSVNADSAHGLGWIDNGSNQVKVAYTFYGDADLTTLLGNYNLSLPLDKPISDSFAIDAAAVQVLSEHGISVNAVPEPSTIALLAAGLAGLLVYWRRSKK